MKIPYIQFPKLAHNVSGIRRFDRPDKRNRQVSQGGQTVAEGNPAKGVPAPQRTPGRGFPEPEPPGRAAKRIPFVKRRFILHSLPSLYNQFFLSVFISFDFITEHTNRVGNLQNYTIKPFRLRRRRMILHLNVGIQVGFPRI